MPTHSLNYAVSIWAARRPGAAQGGITLLEVVIAMAVLAVGIMSIASLLPVGRYQMNQAAVFDHASAVGRAAFRDVQVHGYLRPSTWLYLDTQLRAVTNGPLMTAPPGVPSNLTPQTFGRIPPAVPLVLDPLMVAMNVPPTTGTNFVGATNTTKTAVSTFPYFVRSGGGFSGTAPESSAFKAGVALPRITVRDTPITNITQATIRAIPLGVADRLFRSTDDVGFLVPSAELGLAGSLNQQQNTSIEFLSRPNGSSTLNVSRTSKGDYTYFVVLSPDFSETWGAPGGYPYGSAAPTMTYNMLQGNASTNRLYNVAVVVCYQRDLRTLTNFTPATTYDRGERMAWVDFVGRGDVRLRVMGISQQAQAQQLLDVKPNQWIMVTGQLTNYSPMPPLRPNFVGQPWTQTVVKWYRVLSVASQATQDLNSPTAWYRSARIAGPDWTINGASDANPQNMIYIDANPFSYSDLGNSQMPNPPTGWGTIVSGAVGVYEKTVNLDDSSAFAY